MPKFCPPICRQEVQSAAAHVDSLSLSASAPGLALAFALLVLAALAWFRQRRSRRVPA